MGWPQSAQVLPAAVERGLEEGRHAFAGPPFLLVEIYISLAQEYLLLSGRLLQILSSAPSRPHKKILFVRGEHQCKIDSD